MQSIIIHVTRKYYVYSLFLSPSTAMFCRTLTARLSQSGDCFALFINCNVESDKQMAQVNKVSECAKPMKRAFFTLKMVKIKCTVKN